MRSYALANVRPRQGKNQRRKRKTEREKAEQREKQATDHYSHNADAISISAMASMAGGTM
jgi:hypothetical protein